MVAIVNEESRIMVSGTTSTLAIVTFLKEGLAEPLAFLVFLYIKQKEKFVRSISEVKLPESCKGKTQNCLQLVLYIVIAKNWSKCQLSCS